LRIFTEEIFERLDPTQRYFQCICLGELSDRSILLGSLHCFTSIVSPRYHQDWSTVPSRQLSNESLFSPRRNWILAIIGGTDVRKRLVVYDLIVSHYYT